MADVPGFEIVTPSVRESWELATVHVQGWRDAYRGLLPPSFYDDSTLEPRRESWVRLLGSLGEDDTVLAAKAEGGLIGFAFAGQVRDVAPVRELELYSLYILSSWYGSGVAAALLESCLREKPAQLWVAQQNARAIAFYRKHGFELDGTQKVEHRLDDLIEVRMIR